MVGFMYDLMWRWYVLSDMHATFIMFNIQKVYLQNFLRQKKTNTATFTQFNFLLQEPVTDLSYSVHFVQDH